MNLYRVSILLRPRAADAPGPTFLWAVVVYALDPDEACEEGRLAALMRWPGFDGRHVVALKLTDHGDEVQPSGRRGRQP